jgi:hypothetical protein
MADFTPKKVSAEKGSAKGSLAHNNAEHQAPPSIYLEHHHLAKLGMDKMPPVGSKIKISGLAHVGATSEHQDSKQEPGRKIGTGATTPANTRRSMTLHLHKMEVGQEGITDEVKSESQKAGAKGEMDKALSREMGGKKGKRSEGGEGDNAADNAPRASNGPKA